MYTVKRGGAYDRFLMMLEAFLERGVEVHCLSLTPIPIKHYLFFNHKMYFPSKKADGLFPRMLVLILFPFWSVWVGYSNRIDLIISFGSLYAFIQTLSKNILKRPMVTFIRGNMFFGSKWQNSSKTILCLTKTIEEIGIRYSDRIITNNEASRSEILRKKVDVQVLYNNIPSINISKSEDISKTREKYGVPLNVRILVTAGILNRGKNIEFLIECLSKLETKDIYLLIVGDGSTRTDLHYKESLKELTRRLGIEQWVIFTGWLEKEELWKIYQVSDLFVIPSLNEGMPNALLEAIGCDLPCLGSDIPGINDILHYKDLLFDPVNLETIANRIRRFFSDEQYTNHLIQLIRKRKKIFVFDWKEKVFQLITKEISLGLVN